MTHARLLIPLLWGVDENIFQGGYQFNELATGWYPQVVLVNESSLYQKSGVVLRVQPDGTSTLIETLNAAAESEINMSRFPFDEHRLDAIFEVLGFDKDEVLLAIGVGCDRLPSQRSSYSSMDRHRNAYVCPRSRCILRRTPWDFVSVCR